MSETKTVQLYYLSKQTADTLTNEGVPAIESPTCSTYSTNYDVIMLYYNVCGGGVCVSGGLFIGGGLCVNDSMCIHRRIQRGGVQGVRPLLFEYQKIHCNCNCKGIAKKQHKLKLVAYYVQTL